MEKSLEFSSNIDDPRINFLSNDSKHSFILEDRKWLSVDHYIQSKKFEGTLFENEIRLSPTMKIVKQLTKPRYRVFYDKEGNRNIELSYGNYTQNFYIRDDWEDVRYELLKKAIYAKFDQNPQLHEKLLETRNVRLVNLDDNMSGLILEDYRSEIKNKILGKHNNVIKFNLMKDIESYDTVLIKNIVTILLNIVSLERFNKVMYEMVEDVILLVVPKKLIKKVLLHTKKFCNLDSHIIFKNLPKTNKLIVETEKFLNIKLKRNSEEEIEKISLLICSFVKWFLIETSEKERKIIYENILKYSSSPENMKLPKVKRSYRQHPPNVTPSGGNNFKIKQLLLACKLVLYSLVNDNLYSDEEIKRIINQEIKSTIKVEDKELQIYINEFKQYKPFSDPKDNILPMSKFISFIFEKHNINISSHKIYKLVSEILGKDIVDDTYEKIIEEKLNKEEYVSFSKNLEVFIVLDYSEDSNFLTANYPKEKKFKNFLKDNERILFKRDIKRIGETYIFYKKYLYVIEESLNKHAIEYKKINFDGVVFVPISDDTEIPKKIYSDDEIEYDQEIIKKIYDLIIEYYRNKHKKGTQELTLNVIKNKLGIDLNQVISKNGDTYKSYILLFTKLIDNVPLNPEIEKYKNDTYSITSLDVPKYKDELIEKFGGYPDKKTYNPFKIFFPKTVDYEKLEKFIMENMENVSKNKLDYVVNDLLNSKIDEILENSLIINKIFNPKQDTISENALSAYINLRICENIFSVEEQIQTKGDFSKIKKHISRHQKSKLLNDKGKEILEKSIWNIYILYTHLSVDGYNKFMRILKDFDNSILKIKENFKLDPDIKFSKDDFFILKAIKRIDTISKFYFPSNDNVFTPKILLDCVTILYSRSIDVIKNIFDDYKESFNEDDLEAYLKINNINYSLDVFLDLVNSFKTREKDKEKLAILFMIILKVINNDQLNDKKLAKKIILFSDLK